MSLHSNHLQPSRLPTSSPTAATNLNPPPSTASPSTVGRRKPWLLGSFSARIALRGQLRQLTPPRRPSAGGVRGDPHRAGRVRGRPRRRLERGRAAVPLPPLGGRGWRSGWKRVDAAVELVVDAWRTVKGGVERLGESRRVRQRLRAIHQIPKMFDLKGFEIR